jgi:hypothetical protein
MSDFSAFAEHIWIVEGPSVRDMRVMSTTRVTVVKICDGSLWVDPLFQCLLRRSTASPNRGSTEVTRLSEGTAAGYDNRKRENKF